MYVNMCILITKLTDHKKVTTTIIQTLVYSTIQSKQSNII
jgi:hypothetical protein